MTKEADGIKLNGMRVKHIGLLVEVEIKPIDELQGITKGAEGWVELGEGDQGNVSYL